MHWRAGFRRVVAAAAILYWLIAALFIAAAVNDNFIDMYASPLGPKYEVYGYEWDNGGIGSVRALSASEADKWLNAASYGYPNAGESKRLYSPWNYRLTFGEAVQRVGKTIGIAIFSWIVIVGVYMGVRWVARGFLDGDAAQARP